MFSKAQSAERPAQFVNKDSWTFSTHLIIRLGPNHFVETSDGSAGILSNLQTVRVQLELAGPHPRPLVEAAQA